MHHVYVVSSFLHAGVPIAKLTYFRDILEENLVRLTYRRNMQLPWMHYPNKFLSLHKIFLENLKIE